MFETKKFNKDGPNKEFPPLEVPVSQGTSAWQLFSIGLVEFAKVTSVNPQKAVSNSERTRRSLES